MRPEVFVATSRNINADHQQSLNPLERWAVAITRRVGSMGFFLAILIWTVLWLGWNLLAPPALKFDAPMSFAFWLFISNMIQILLMPLIMVGQNLQGRHSEIRAENDYNVNVKAEREVAWLMGQMAHQSRQLEHQTRLITALLIRNGLTLEEALRLVPDTPPPPRS